MNRIVGAIRHRTDVVSSAAYRIAGGDSQTNANQRNRNQLLNHDAPSVMGVERPWP